MSEDLIRARLFREFKGAEFGIDDPVGAATVKSEGNEMWNGPSTRTSVHRGAIRGGHFGLHFSSVNRIIAMVVDTLSKQT